MVFAQADPFEGTWKLNVAKSKLSRPLQSAVMTLRVGIDDESPRQSIERMSLEIVTAGGTREGIRYTSRYSGRPGGDFWVTDLVSGKEVPEEAVLKIIDDNTREFSRVKGNTVVATTRRTLSSDRKVITAHETVKRADGTSIEEVWVWERQ
ncbi:MAG: hypothetical protein FJZ00_02945 [Candidatus Sericytochromatia bacterium]|uniref:Uncharacterized protein n=1 Tax=Candidatus Tanganyikabacteria bacterium TaxID=2961651 RepID=A0A938BMB1_9BACT|nr:hypothetical protein [Candidatus Tanganyikabacteria bacterium]